MSRNKNGDLTEEQLETVRMMVMKPHAYKLHLEHRRKKENGRRETMQQETTTTQEKIKPH